MSDENSQPQDDKDLSLQGANNKTEQIEENDNEETKTVEKQESELAKAPPPDKEGDGGRAPEEETPEEEEEEEEEENIETAPEATNTEETEEELDEELLEGDLDHIGGSKKTALRTSTGKQAENTGRNWYVIHTYSGYEDAVEKAIRQRIESLNMHELIYDVIVPKESTITIKKGEHVTEKKRLFPGYVLVDMIVTDESWYVVRNTPNVTGFVGSGTTPVPVLPEEFNIIKKHLRQEEPKFNIAFKVGENVTINDGPFKDYEGLISEVDEKKGKVKVLVTLFGRETPVELDFVQVNKK